MKSIINNYKQTILPPYGKKNLLSISLTVLALFGLISLIYVTNQKSSLQSKAASINTIETETGVLAGNATVVDDANASGGKYIRLGTTGSTPTITPTPSPTNNTNILEGSFFQPYLVENWTATQFATEFQYMKNVKMDHVIWQWTVDSLPSRKWTYYPTTMPGFTQHNTTDAVGISLAQAQAKGLKVWLGLNWTDDWFSKGASDQTWLTNEFTISKNTAKELWSRYGTQYGDTIVGFYLTMEVDNVNFMTTTLQDRMIAVYADTSNYIHTETGKPVMVAPFFNTSIGQNATQHADMWGRIVANAPLDVVAVQDGIGVGHATTANIGSWLSPMRTAIKTARPSTQFWSDLETLNPNYTPASVTRVIEQLNAEKAYVDKFTTFSFNHYDSPQQGQTTNYNAWKAYTDSH